MVCDSESHGERVLMSVTLMELMPILAEANEEKIADAGGPSAWNVLSTDEVRKHLHHFLLKRSMRFIFWSGWAAVCIRK